MGSPLQIAKVLLQVPDPLLLQALWKREPVYIIRVLASLELPQAVVVLLNYIS